MLVNVGEGMVPDDVRQPFVDSAGGDTVVIAVLPQSLQRAERGKASVTEFLVCGVAEHTSSNRRIANECEVNFAVQLRSVFPAEVNVSSTPC